MAGDEPRLMTISDRGIPVVVGPTTRQRHITGTAALNIPDRWDVGGDWHMHATWFATEPESLLSRDFTDDETYAGVFETLCTGGVRVFVTARI